MLDPTYSVRDGEGRSWTNNWKSDQQEENNEDETKEDEQTEEPPDKHIPIDDDVLMKMKVDQLKTKLQFTGQLVPGNKKILQEQFKISLETNYLFLPMQPSLDIVGWQQKTMG